MTSVPVEILGSVAVVAGFYACGLDMHKRNYLRQLVARIKAQDTGKWQTLPWLYRGLMPGAGLGIVFKTSSVSDAVSLGLYQKLRRIEYKQMGALIVCAAAIVVLLIGMLFWGWSR